MGDQRINRDGGRRLVRRILKWLAIAVWGSAILMAVVAWILFERGDEFGYSACGEMAVVSANVALVPSCLYVLFIVVEKWSRSRTEK